MTRVALALGLLIVGPAQASLLRGAATTADPRLTDGVRAADGDDWLSPPAVQLSAEVQWDLGSSQPMRRASVQADNNDSYLLAASEDGVRWIEVLHIPPAPLPGLRTRTGDFAAQGRYFRLRPMGGDGRYSVSEVELFADSPRASPLAALLQLREAHPLETLWLAVLLAAALALGVIRARSRRWIAWPVGAALAAFAGAVAYRSVGDPAISADTLAWIRWTAAAGALVAVGRETFGRAKAHRGLVLGVLGASGVLALICFVNLLRPQFFDAGRGSPTFLHHYDMRAYYPIARYFPELRFDGVYAGSIAAMADDPGGLEPLSHHRLRNLRTHHVQSVAESREYIAEIRARFDPARWAGFVADMTYFRAAMNDGGFIGSMNDHGGNATPVWLLGARLLFARLPASDFSLWLGVAVDCLLLALAFAALGWAYGPKTALVAMTAFGAMDFYQFGTNWFGAPLRHDWLALWCLGLACLKKQHFALGGGLLAWSALIRAFPVLALLALAVPVGWALGRALKLERSRFSPGRFFQGQRPFVRVVVAVAVTTAVLGGLSVLGFGFGAWPDWLRKVILLGGGHPNNIALSSVLTTPWLLVLTAVTFTGCVVVAVRDAPLDEAAAFGAVLLGIVLQPANYYLHCLFVLAVLGRERSSAPRPGAWLILLAMCAGCYLTTFTPHWQQHFIQASWLMLAAVFLLTAYWGAKSFGVDHGKPIESLRSM